MDRHAPDEKDGGERERSPIRLRIEQKADARSEQEQRSGVDPERLARDGAFHRLQS
jgi:hypothetical protein